MLLDERSGEGIGKAMIGALEGVNKITGRAYSPPCEGGVAAPQKNGPVPKRRGRGGQFGEMFRPEDFAELTTPSAALRWLRDLLLMPQPPLLYKEGKAPVFQETLPCERVS